MSTSLESAVRSYVKALGLSSRSCDEHFSTVRKWERWGKGKSIESLSRHDIREFIEWVHDLAVQNAGTNPGRTANKVRENLKAVLSWAWEQDLIESVPRLPKPRFQRDVAGRHYLTKSELNALYFATYALPRSRGWNHPYPVGNYWRAALVLFFNYGLDTGTIWKTNSSHQPILWRHVTWQQVSPNTQTRERSRWGWILYRRAKTGKMFVRPMNRVVHAHVRSLQHNDCDPESPVFTGGSSRPNLRFRQLCSIAGLEPRLNMESGAEEPWQLKDLRKTCATYYEEHIPGSSVEILGHYARGITYRHYAHRDPLAAKAIMTIPQPTAFTGLAKGITDMCPCCRRPFSAAE